MKLFVSVRRRLIKDKAVDFMMLFLRQSHVAKFFELARHKWRGNKMHISYTNNSVAFDVWSMCYHEAYLLPTTKLL